MNSPYIAGKTDVLGCGKHTHTHTLQDLPRTSIVNTAAQTCTDFIAQGYKYGDCSNTSSVPSPVQLNCSPLIEAAGCKT